MDNIFSYIIYKIFSILTGGSLSFHSIQEHIAGYTSALGIGGVGSFIIAWLIARKIRSVLFRFLSIAVIGLIIFWLFSNGIIKI